jgi:ELWxxDGT repeat protein
MRFWFLTAFMGLFAVPVWSAAGPAHLVADLNPGTVAWDPNATSTFQFFTRLGHRTLFMGFLYNDFQCGLWATDGTAAGTERLVDLCAESLSDSFYPSQILGVAGRLAFVLDSSARLWRTDGTAAGTFPLGATVSTLGGTTLGGPGGIFYFAGCNAAGQCEPWRSDGTVAGTRMLRAVQGAAGTFLQFVADGNRVAFSGAGPAGPTLWTTDGTSQGTRELARLPRAVERLVALDGALYASTRDSSTSELWFVPSGGRAARRLGRFPIDEYRSPGVRVFKVGGRLLLEDDVGDGLVDLWEIAAFHHRPQFLARFEGGLGPVAPAGGGVILAGAESPLDERFTLWFLAPGTRRPTPLSGCPGGCPSVLPFFSQLGVLGDRAVFAGLDSGSGEELWETDGTAPGTRLLKNLCTGECETPPSGFTPALGRLLFTAGDSDLWVTDGTAAGTAQLGRILSPSEDSLDLAVMNGRVVFNGIDAVAGSQPSVSDLTAAGTAPILTVGASLAAGAAIQSLTPFGSGVLFSACSPDGTDSWHSDGTAAGTVRLGAVNPECGGFSLGPIATTGDLAFFSPDSTHLWRTDGTLAGSLILASWSDRLISGFLPLNGGLFFVAGAANSPLPFTWDFWRSDGTSQGTLQTGSLSFDGGIFIVGTAGSAAFFVAGSSEPPFAVTLWRSDGTAAGTRAILDLASPPGQEDFVLLNGKVLLVMGSTERQERELWTSDGTAAGTVPVIDDPNAPRPLNPRSLTVFQGDLYFLAEDPGRLVSLWRSDGTEAGTFPVVDFSTLTDPTLFEPSALTAAGGFLFFRLDDGVHGEELWRTDGTAAGTVMVKDIAPGPAQSRLEGLTAAGGRLYFTATDGEHGLELWTSDGTAEGTRMVQDIFPGPSSSWPQDLVATDGNLFFTAVDGVHGRELWVLPLAPWR